VVEGATLFLVPTRIPVLFLTRGATVPGVLALRANFEVLKKPHNLAPVVAAIRSPIRRDSKCSGAS
jgi:DNA-binding response OmpR family regulator